MAAIPQDLDAPSLPEYFRPLIKEAMEHQRVPPTEGVEFYLVNLLQACLLTHAVFGKPSEGFQEEPLALIFIRACQANSELQIRLLKQLGDFSLFISGFFPASLTRRLVDIDYYIQMGESAYGSLSQLMARHRAFSEIFTELAGRFVVYVDILSEVSEKTSLNKDSDLLRLYEHWLKTGSERAARLLCQEGILPIRNVPSSKTPN